MPALTTDLLPARGAGTTAGPGAAPANARPAGERA